jgi:D-alanine transaminase
VGRRDKNFESTDKMSEIVYLNGNYLPRNEAFISPEDRGFNFADGVYEVVKYYRGKPFRMKDHLNRLENSLSAVNIDFHLTGQLETVFSSLLKMNKLEASDAGIYLQITRGVHKRIHHFPDISEPTVYAFAFSFPSNHDGLKNGIKVITAEDIRWLRCDIKSVSLLPNTMLYQSAVEKGAGECILHRDGKITEATHSSVAGIKNGKLYTHPLSNLILPGITRKVVLEICHTEGIPFEEVAISKDELHLMDELFIAGTGSEILPVVKTDGFSIGDGTPGPLTRRIQNHFFSLVSG